MRFHFVLAVAAALTASVSAADADTEFCPIICIRDRDCDTCEFGPVCVSMSSFYLIK